MIQTPEWKLYFTKDNEVNDEIDWEEFFYKEWNFKKHAKQTCSSPA